MSNCFTQSSFDWFIGPLLHWFTESSLRWFIEYWFTESTVLHWLIDSLIHWFLDSLIHMFIRSLGGWFVSQCCITSLIYWIIGSFTQLRTGSLMSFHWDLNHHFLIRWCTSQLQPLMVSVFQKLSYRPLISYSRFLFSKLPPRRVSFTIWPYYNQLFWFLGCWQGAQAFG